MRSRSKGKKQIFWRLAVALIVIASGVSAVTIRKNDENNTSKEDAQSTIVSTVESYELNDSGVDTVVVEVTAVFDAVELQGVIDSWVDSVSGAASVAVLDENGVLLASVDKDRQYFAASIYKLYVAYYGYQEIDQGRADRGEEYVGGQTRGECLDLMIRESDSPCAEKMWVELGKNHVTSELQSIGASNTDMTALSTTAYDAALVMARISRSEGLSDVSQAAFLASARDQVYRDALNSGFSEAMTIYNKIGFRDFDEYHDVAIVELADGRQFILAVLTDGVGARNIADLGAQIEGIILD